MCHKLIDLSIEEPLYPYRPAHRLCENGRMASYAETLIAPPPLSARQLQAIYSAILDGATFTRGQVRLLKSIIWATATWTERDDEAFDTGYDGRSRGTVYALTFIKQACQGFRGPRSLRIAAKVAGVAHKD